MTSELVPIFRDLQKYYKEMERGRTWDRGNRRIGVVLNEHKFTKKIMWMGESGKRKQIHRFALSSIPRLFLNILQTQTA